LTGQVVKRRAPPPDDAIQLGVDINGKGKRGIRFGFVLLIFMRLVAALWMFRGLLHWHTIISSDQEPFARMDSTIAAVTMFFAVADLLAAVGLWLATSWGGVLWLFAAASGLVVTLVLPGVGWGGHILFGADLILIVAYFVLSWYAARERDE
jgi:Family of unknown function (DUF6163)